MCKIVVLSKKQVLKTEVRETVSEVWEMLMQTELNASYTRDYLLLHDNKDNTVIINKRYMYKVE